MSLAGQSIPVLFSGGLDQKTAEQLVIPGKFLVLENCVRRKLGKVQKRYGYDHLGVEVVGGSDIDAGTRLAKLNNDLLLINDDAVYSYASSSNRWIDKGDITSVLVDTDPFVRNSDRQALGDVNTSGGITVAAWEDSRGGVRYSVVDDSTGATILYDQVADAAGSKPKVVVANDTFLIMYRDTSDFILCRIIAAAAPTTVSAPVTIDGTAYDLFDACSHGDLYALVAGVQTGSGEVTTMYVNAAGEVGNGANGLPTPKTITEAAVDVVTVVSDYDNNALYVAYIGSAEDLKVTAYPSHMLTSSTVTVENEPDVGNIGGAIDADDNLRLFYEVSAAASYDHFVKTAVVAFDGTTATVDTAAAIFKRSVGLATKPFLQGTSVYINVAFETTLQPTYFTVRDDGFIVARALAGTGGGLTRDTQLSPALTSALCRVVETDDGIHKCLLQVRLKLQADESGSILSTARGLNLTTFDFSGANFFSEQVGQNLHISGGVLLAYDGVSAGELGFHVYPELAAGSTAQTVGGGSLSAGDYRVCVTYEWVDAQGQIQRSAPSIPQTVTVGANDRITISNIPTLRLTTKTSPRAEAKIVVWRTIADGIEVFYRDVETDNDPTLDTPAAAAVLSQSDASLAANEVLYTVGGVLENVAPPASKTAIRHKNRLWLGGTEEGSTLGYSKEHVFGEAVAFADGFSIPVEPGSGDITALASMDDKLVIFKRDRIYAMVGDGPLDTGAQNDFTLPQLITADAGAINQASVVSQPAGIMFKSDKGIYLLTRSLGVEYVGAPVEDFNSYTVTGAQLLEDVNEIRFTTSDGEVLVYNYFFDQWSTFTEYAAVSSINALGSWCTLRSDGRVRKENTDYLDAGGRYSMNIETSWLAFAGVSGYQRVWEVLLLGDYLSTHYARVKLAYDYEDSFIETVVFDVAEELDISTYGDDATYGSSSVYGGEGSSVFEFSIRPRRQKCTAVKLRISDVDTITEAGGASFALAAVTVEVGVKKGGNKNAAAVGSL